MRLMNFISVTLIPMSFVSMSVFYNHIKRMLKLKYNVLQIDIVFGLNLILKHGSGFPKFVKIYVFLSYVLRLFLWNFTSHICERIDLFQHTVVWSLDVVTLDFTGDIFIPNWFMVLWKYTCIMFFSYLTRLTHKIAIQLHLVAESCTIYSSRSSRRPVRKLLDTPSYFKISVCDGRATLHR
jgi:hypothetical protein